MIICTTPALGFSATLQSEHYPYFVGSGYPTPQVGAVVDTIDSDAGTAARYTMTDTSGVYSWEAPAP